MTVKILSKNYSTIVKNFDFLTNNFKIWLKIAIFKKIFRKKPSNIRNYPLVLEKDRYASNTLKK